MDDDGAASPSPSPSPSRSPSPLPLADPVTVAAAPPGHLALAIPIHKPGPSSGGGGGGGREDAWSDGATSTLIDAWGERFVALGRGSLRHPQWQEVAEVVSSRDSYSKPAKSDVQCKNRIDTLKKKYKVEKAKSDSSWPFFDRLDYLLAPVHKPGGGGSAGAAAGNSGSSNPGTRSTAPMMPRVNFPQRTRTAHLPSPGMKRRLPSPPQASASSESSDGFPPEPLMEAANGKWQRVEEAVNGADSSDRVQGLRDLAQAIRRFGEAYERVEASKREQELRLERDRLDAARELEDQRVQFFLKMQMEISKANNGAPFAPAAMVANSAAAAVAADGNTRAAADGNGPRRTATATDAATSSNHHVRVKEGRQHHSSHHPPYQYNQNNVDAAATGTGSGSDSDNKEDEEEMEEDEEESQ